MKKENKPRVETLVEEEKSDVKPKEKLFDTDNHLKVEIIDKKTKNKYVEQECCTCINILLTNDGEIATSFLGVHNTEIVNLLEKAQKLYFKKIKKEFKKQSDSIKKQSKKYSSIKVKNKKLSVTFDKDNNDYDSASPVSASDVISNKSTTKKSTEGEK
ncbi:MAG: hypothetical protein J6V40_01755 [Clostridia bacterium]|nr:hypothetical protein [Clostridia bacterium]